MHNSLFDELDKSIADLFEHTDGLFLRDFPPFLHKPPELPSIAELLDDVVAVLALHDIEEPHHVGAFERLQDLYF